MNAISKNKKIYVIRYSDRHFVSNDILSYGEDLIEHIAVTKDLPDSYSFTNPNGSLPLIYCRKLNRLMVIQLDKIIADRSAIIKYSPDMYLKNSVAIHIHLDYPTIALELTLNINEAYHYNPLHQKICREHYSLCFFNAKFYSVKIKLNNTNPIS